MFGLMSFREVIFMPILFGNRLITCLHFICFRKRCFLWKAASQDPKNLSPCSSVLTDRETLGDEKSRILHITSGCRKTLKHVCSTHLDKFLLKYPLHQKQCCDPFGDHKEAEKKAQENPPPSKKRKYGKSGQQGGKLDVISLTLRDKVKQSGCTWFAHMIPGRKLCVTCKCKVYGEIKGEKSEGPLFSSPSVHSSQPAFEDNQQFPTPPVRKEDDEDTDFEFKDLNDLNL